MEEINKELQQEIRNSANELFADIEKELNEIYKENKSSRDKLIAFILVLYNKYSNEDGVIEGINKYSIASKINKEFKKVFDELIKNETKIVNKILTNTSQNSYYKNYFILDSGKNFKLKKDFTNIDWDKLVNEKIKGEVWSKRIWKNRNEVYKTLTSEIKNSIKDGKDFNAINKILVDKFNVNANQAKRLVLTEGNRVITSAQDLCFNNSNVVKKIMYDAVLDKRTSKICQKLDGKIFVVGTKYPKPPQHPNCRSILIPITDGWKPKTKLDNETKQQIPYLTYSEYKEKYINKK